MGRPTREDAENAIRQLIRWAGDDPEREGLVDTPSRAIRAFEEHFSGYEKSPDDLLLRTFKEVEGYNDVIILRNIPFESHCEHHLSPILGQAHVAYMPSSRVVGISKLARVVDIYAKRLQIQEKMTAQIATAITRTLNPRGVLVIVQATHQCITCRGVHKAGVDMITSFATGHLDEDYEAKESVLRMLNLRTLP